MIFAVIWFLSAAVWFGSAVYLFTIERYTAGLFEVLLSAACVNVGVMYVVIS